MAEFALLLPILCFLFAAAIDFARVFYFGVTVENCARNGAYYASDYPNNSYVYNDIYGYTSLADAITRDAGNLSPTPTWTVGYSSSADGPFSDSPPAGGGGPPRPRRPARARPMAGAESAGMPGAPSLVLPGN